MNLLVTNTRNAQAYAIIRALRPHAEKIVATMEGDNRLAARLSHAVNSRASRVMAEGLSMPGFASFRP